MYSGLDTTTSRSSRGSSTRTDLLSPTTAARRCGSPSLARICRIASCEAEKGIPPWRLAAASPPANATAPAPRIKVAAKPATHAEIRRAAVPLELHMGPSLLDELPFSGVNSNSQKLDSRVTNAAVVLLHNVTNH